jgi:hypothetical protein
MNVYDRWITNDADGDRSYLEANAWRDCRADELHSDPRLLASAISDCLDADVALGDLLVALTSLEKGATAGDNMILQHSAAMTVIDRLVERVINVEQKRRCDG